MPPTDPSIAPSAEVRDLRRWEQLLEGEVRILAKLVGESDLTETLEGICRLIEAFNPDILSSVLLLDPDGVTVRLGAAPSLPGDYWRALDGLRIGPAAGSCGTAMHRREPVVVEDIGTDPLWAPYKALALPHGLRACWSTPIVSGDGRVEGSFAMYFGTPRAPTPEDLRLVGFASRLTGVAVDRIRAHMRLQAAITELEEARRAAEQANRAKSAFLAGMSHELRTPLNAILLLSELMAQDARNEQEAQDLQSIRAAGQHLLSLVNGVLDLSKIEAGAMEVHLEEVRVGELMGDLAASLRPLVEAQENRLELVRDPDLETLRTDFTKLRQVLCNLVGNANKFTERGVVTLEARRAGAEVHFHVRDTGIGMTPEQMGRVFEAFAQAEPDTGRRYGGTGLGLALSRRLCELLGGRITVDSAPGVGTTFTAALPLG